VPYGRLLDDARAGLYARLGNTPWRLRLLRGLVRHPRAIGLLGALARFARRLGLAALWPELAQVPPPGPPLADSRDADTRAGVVLFRGCLASAFDRETLAAAERLLQAAGIHYRTSGAACCGALHQHNGDVSTARALAEANRERFAGAHTVLYCASGCGATLLDYPRLAPAADAWPAFTEITAFLAREGRMDELPFRDRPGRVLVHEPCSSRNVTRSGAATPQLLERLPGLQVESLRNGPCCGAAGAYHLLQPELASRLRERLLEPIRASGVDTLVTTNLGCQLWLGAALRKTGVRVVHPLTLLAGQLAD
jgi:glycolate oxidase iron-sulfur subunit